MLISYLTQLLEIDEQSHFLFFLYHKRNLFFIILILYHKSHFFSTCSKSHLSQKVNYSILFNDVTPKLLKKIIIFTISHYTLKHLYN